jgi:2-polyprenyl-6-methoxyphenol hydroxylase-like FAD-dependent oxidoreductase
MDTVDIIGGGIGGLAMANALQHQQIHFRLFEQAHQISEVGAAISISKAALEILDKLGLGVAVRQEGYETRHFNIANKNLQLIRKTTTQYPVTIIHRAKLVDILVSKIPRERISLNTKLTGISNHQMHAELLFSDSTVRNSSCTVIADGIHSTARNQIFPNLKIRFSNQTIWRGISKMEWPLEYSHTYTEVWSGSKRFLFVPMDAERIFWLAIINEPPGGKDQPETVRGKLMEEFRGFHPLVLQMLENSGNFIRSDLADLGTNRRNWFAGNIVFLGDSIHATTPNLGQGGNQAIEDAYCLAQLMRQGKNDLTKVFAAYQKRREKKVRFIINRSWMMGKLSQNQISSQIARILFKYMPNKTVDSLEHRLNDLTYLDQPLY